MSDQQNTEQTKSKSNWKEREMGALWKKQGKDQTYLSGRLEVDEFGTKKTIDVVIYSNKYKEKDNHPDFRVYRSQKLNEATEQTQSDEVSEIL